MDANSRIWAKIALGRREKDKGANGNTFFGNKDTELFFMG